MLLTNQGLNLESLGVPAFLIEANGARRRPSGRRNALYEASFPQCVGPLERLLEDAWPINGDRRLRPEDVEHDVPHLGQTRCWRTTLVPVDAREGRPGGLLGVCMDITVSKLRDRRLADLVYEDGLTGASNRRRFDLDLEEAIRTAAATGRPFSVVVADVDRFKAINDLNGHQAGDAALCAVARCMRETLRKDDRVYRIGGDEFAAILGAGTRAALSSVLRRLEQGFARWPPVGTIRLQVSVGGTIWAEDSTACRMLQLADTGMYAEKDRRRRVSS